jgi:hypothetical protein
MRRAAIRCLAIGLAALLVGLFLGKTRVEGAESIVEEIRREDGVTELVHCTVCGYQESTMGRWTVLAGAALSAVGLGLWLLSLRRWTGPLRRSASTGLVGDRDNEPP